VSRWHGHLALGTWVAYAEGVMRSTGALIGILLATVPARADVWGDLGADQRAVAQLEATRDEADSRRGVLEQQSQQLASQIDRAKDEPAGVRHDAKLQDLLAAQKAKSDELERVAGDLRGRGSLLAGARRKLVADCDRALAASLPEAKRLELTRLRTAQVAALALPMTTIDRPIGVARAASDPLDGPRELQDKADLLRDSGDKLRREVQRLAGRIDSVERRRHLRERAGAVDEDLFGEAASNRRSARVASTTLSSAGDRSQGAASPSAGVPTTGGTGATGGGGAGGSGGGAPGGGNNPGGATPSGGDHGGTTADATVLRNLVDPATLDELRRADGGDDLDRQLRALRRAQNELSGMASELDRRARSLATRADELKHKK
jgi:hypothetical protein